MSIVMAYLKRLRNAIRKRPDYLYNFQFVTIERRGLARCHWSKIFTRWNFKI